MKIGRLLRLWRSEPADRVSPDQQPVEALEHDDLEVSEEASVDGQDVAKEPARD